MHIIAAKAVAFGEALKDDFKTYQKNIVANAAVLAEELIARGEEADYDDILAKVIERDHNDSTRAVSPLQQAPDAVLIDSTNLDIDGVVEKMISIIEANK